MKIKTISNKVVATVLCALMLVSSMVVSGVVSSANITDVWNGEILTAPTVGSGSETEPFEISTAEELAYAINAFGKKADGTAAYYKLTADIYLNDTSSNDWLSDTVAKNPWFSGKDENSYYSLNGSQSGAFVGSIDGSGHMVYGLWYPETTGSFASGLVPVFSGSYIRNLGVDKAYIVSNLSSTNGDKGAGAIAGITLGSLMTIDSCFSGADVTVKSNVSGASGIVGAVRNGAEHKLTISNCYSLIPNSNIIMKNEGTDRAADSTYGTYANGIIGNTWACYFSVTNSYSVAKPFLLNHKNRLSLDCLNEAGTAASSAIITNFANVYSASDVTKAWNNKFPTWGTYTDEEIGTAHYVAVQLSASQMQGENALSNMLLGDKFVATDTYPALKVFVPEDSDNDTNSWNGDLAEPENGEGTAKTPYEISTAAQLAYALNEFGKKADGTAAYYKLTADIYLNDVTSDSWISNNNKKWFEGKDENGYYTLDKSAWGAFVGSIDGNGHMVYGLWYPEATTSFASGLIPVFSGSYIRNLGVDKAYIITDLSSDNGDKGAGAVAGITKGSLMSIDSCFSGASVTVRSNVSGASGIVGAVRNGSDHKLTISNCYSLIPNSNIIMKNEGTDRAADSTYGTYANGIIGNTYKNYFSVINSYSIAKPYLLNNKNRLSQDCVNTAGTAASDAIIENFANVYSESDVTKAWQSGRFELWGTYTDGDGAEHYVAVQLSASQMQGKNALNNMLLGDKFVATSSYPVLKPFYNEEDEGGSGGELEPPVDEDLGPVWNGKVATQFAEGSGTEDDPYKITKGSELALAVSMGMGANKYYSVENDIYLNDVTDKYWYEGENNNPWISDDVVFKGYIDGNGYIIYGIYYPKDTENEYSGLIPQMSGGSIKGLGIRSAFVNATHYAAGLVGITVSGKSVNIESCFADETALVNYTTKIDNGGVAGIVGYAKKNMTELNWDLWTVKNGSYPHISVLPASYTYKFFDNGTKGEVWTGYVAEKYASGTGTKEDPYIIETAEQMAKLVIDRNTLGKHYKLACDLYINDVSKANWKENAKTWMVASNHFRGYFDGDGHVVYGLYYDTTGAYAGLFTGFGPNGVIEKVGISEAYILNRGDETNQAYSGGLVANIGSWQSKGEPTDESYERPIIRQCFVDDTVYIESHYAGGLVGGAGSGILLENCYFTGEITGYTDTARLGTLIGNAWSSKNYSIIVNCYTADADGLIPVISSNAAKTAQYTNTYIDGVITKGTAAKKMNLIFMHGQHCKEYMLGFDFSKIWKPVTDGSPVLRCFASAEKFSCKRAPKKVEISFATEGGEELEPIYGYPRFTKLPELPVPTRYGYVFDGWYYYENCTLPVTIDSFPDEDIYIYAKWIQAGFTQDFEGTLDAEYDYNSGVEHLKPGVLGYIPKYVHGGLKSIHALGDSEIDPIWLVSYENRLEVGKEYELTFYAIAKNDGTTGSLDLIHGNNPQCNTGFVGYETLADLAELEVGVWKEYKYTFTANAPYILFRSSAGADIYVDDISVVPTGKTGELGKIIGFSPDDISAEPITENSIFLIIIIIAGIVLAGGAAITAVVLFRRKRTKGGEVK